MFLALLAATISFGGDDRPAKQSMPAAQRFDLRRAVHWMFGKQSSPPKPAANPTPKVDEPSDAHIEHRCRTNVYSDPTVRSSGLKVRVAEGVAYLEGAVENRWQRVRAEQLALRTPGVVRVENNLRTGEFDSNAAPDSSAKETPVGELEFATAVTQSPGNVVTSRPKTLASEPGEPVVTTYTIRRTPTPGERLRPAVAVEKAAKTEPPKPKAGKLIPWKSGPPAGDWLEAIGLTSAPPAPRLAPTEIHRDPMDKEILKLIADCANAKDVAFERKVGDVVLKGSAPPKVLLTLAQQIGALPGVATVSIAPDAAKQLQIPSTSAIE